MAVQWQDACRRVDVLLGFAVEFLSRLVTRMRASSDLSRFVARILGDQFAGETLFSGWTGGVLRLGRGWCRSRPI